MIVRIHWDFTINAFHNTWKIILVPHTRPLFCSTKANYFIDQLWQLLTTSNVCLRTRGMTGQVGGFQNPGVCLQAFPSFPHPLPALLLAPFFAQSLTLVPRSLLLNRTETLATQARGDVILAGGLYHRFPWRPLPPPPHPPGLISNLYFLSSFV